MPKIISFLIEIVDRVVSHSNKILNFSPRVLERFGRSFLYICKYFLTCIALLYLFCFSASFGRCFGRFLAIYLYYIVYSGIWTVLPLGLRRFLLLEILQALYLRIYCRCDAENFCVHYCWCVYYKFGGLPNF